MHVYILVSSEFEVSLVDATNGGTVLMLLLSQVYIYIYMCINMHIDVYIYTRIYICMHVCILVS